MDGLSLFFMYLRPRFDPMVPWIPVESKLASTATCDLKTNKNLEVLINVIVGDAVCFNICSQIVCV